MKNMLSSWPSLISPLSAVLWLGGLLCALMPLEAYEMQAYSMGFLLAGASFLVSLSRHPFPPRLGLAGGLVMAFWALAFASVALSAVPSVSLVYFCLFSTLPLTVLVGAMQAREPAFFNVAGAGLGLVYFALCLSALAQYFFFPELAYKGSVHRPLANPNALGALYSLGIFASAGWLMLAQKQRSKILALVLVVLGAAALVTTSSRGAIVTLVAGLILLGIFARRPLWAHRRYVAFSAILFAAVFALMQVIIPTEGRSFGDEIARSISGEIPVLWTRLDIWSSAWGIIKDHFWTGTGIGTFFLYYPAYRGGDLTSSGLAAHSDPLQFWSEMGVLAPLLFYAIIIAMGVKTWQAVRVLTPDDPRRLYILVPFCALAAMAAHTHIEFHFYNLSLLLVAGAFMGFWLRAVLPQQETDVPQGNLYKRYGYAVIAGAAVLTVMYGFARLQSSYVQVNEARAAIAAGQVEAFADHINKANKLSGGYNANAYVLASTGLLGTLESAPPQTMPAADALALYNQASGLLEKARALNPRLASAVYAQARLLRALEPFNVKPDHAPDVKALLEEALRLDPLHIGVRISLADLYLERGDKKAAFDVLKQGLEWAYRTQNPAVLYDKLAWLAVDMGDMKTHGDAMQKLLEFKNAQRRAKAGS